MWQGEAEGQGKIAVFGSVSMFDDKWLDKEENSKLLDFVFKWLRPGSRLQLHPADMSLDDLATEGRISDLKLLPDTASLAGELRGRQHLLSTCLHLLMGCSHARQVVLCQGHAIPCPSSSCGSHFGVLSLGSANTAPARLSPPRTLCSRRPRCRRRPHNALSTLAERFKGCLQDSEELSRDWMTLFDDKLFKFDTCLIPEAMALYEKLGIKRGALSLIAPQFETPLPPLQPAVFPPAMTEPPPPALELFDLDEHFASEHVRLASLATKCNAGEVDLEYFALEAASIVGLKLPYGAGAKHALAEVFRRVVQYKMVGSLGASAGGGGGGMGAGVSDPGHSAAAMMASPGGAW